MNKIEQLIKENKITKPVVNKYKKVGSNIEMQPAELSEKSVSLRYDEHNIVNNNRIILFNRKAMLCYIFQPVDYDIIIKVLEPSIQTGQTKV